MIGMIHSVTGIVTALRLRWQAIVEVALAYEQANPIKPDAGNAMPDVAAGVRSFPIVRCSDLLYELLSSRTDRQMKRQTRPFIVEVKHKRGTRKPRRSIWGGLDLSAIAAEARNEEQQLPNGQLVDSKVTVVDARP